MANKKILVKQQWFDGNYDDDDYDGKIICECGNQIYLHYNGGELDRTDCKCGKTYYTEAPLIQFWVEQGTL